MQLIDKAKGIIFSRSEEKERQYGPIVDGMIVATDIVTLLSGSRSFDDLESFRYMYALKLSREKYSHKEDNLLDAIAYRIAEIKAIHENGNCMLTLDMFNTLYLTIQDLSYDIDNTRKFIELITKLNITDDDMYKIHLSVELGKEQDAIANKDTAQRILSILKQIKILNLMNNID